MVHALRKELVALIDEDSPCFIGKEFMTAANKKIVQEVLDSRLHGGAPFSVEGRKVGFLSCTHTAGTLAAIDTGPIVHGPMSLEVPHELSHLWCLSSVHHQVSVLHEVHIVGHVLNVFNDHCGALPVDFNRFFKSVLRRVHRGDETKIMAARTQFLQFDNKTGAYKQPFEGIHAHLMATARARDTKTAAELGFMRPLERCIHDLKLMPLEKLGQT